MLKAVMALTGAIVMAATLPAANAQTVSLNEAAFDSIRNVTNYSFPFTGAPESAETYTQDGVTFTGLSQTEVGPGSGGEPTAFLGEQVSQTITFDGPVLGLRIASAAPVSYNFNGRSGMFKPGALGQPTFIGFDTGSAAPVNVRLFASSFDITGFQTALPEATTWAMMMIGLGVAGGALRRRRPVTTGSRLA